MSRWRPPPPRSTAIITRAGYESLRAELDELWRRRRPEVVAALAAAAAEGDRSENAEYTYRKKQLGEIDRRVRYLSKRLPSLKVVDEAPSDTGAIWFGAWFEVEDIEGARVRHPHRRTGRDRREAWPHQHRLAARSGGLAQTRGRRVRGRAACRQCELSGVLDRLCGCGVSSREKASQRQQWQCR